MTEQSNDDDLIDGDFDLVTRIRAMNYDGDIARSHLNPDSDLLKKNATPEGFVIMFNVRLELIEPAGMYLLYKYRARRGRHWLNTHKAYADDLANWWKYLQFNGLEWDAIESEDISAFQHALREGVSIVTSRNFSSATIERRIGTVCDFYRWAYLEAIIDFPIGFETSKRNRSRPSAFRHNEIIRTFEISDFKKVMLRLGPSILDCDHTDQRPFRNRLAAEIALYTGMRVGEIAGLSILQFLPHHMEAQILDDIQYQKPRDAYRLIPIKLKKTKIYDERTVFVPAFVVAMSLKYIDTERAAVVERGRELGKFQHSEPYALFLNGLTSSHRNLGHAVTEDTLMRAFSQAVILEGLTDLLPGFVIDPDTLDRKCDPDTNEYLIEPQITPRYTFHDLRHTFAVQFYRTEVKSGNAEPWKKLQVYLGHRSMAVTMNTYLKHVSVDEANLSDAYAEYMRQLHEEI